MTLLVLALAYIVGVWLDSALMWVAPLVLLPLTPLLKYSHGSNGPLVEVVARRLIVNTEPRTRHQDTAPTVLVPFSID